LYCYHTRIEVLLVGIIEMYRSEQRTVITGPPVQLVQSTGTCSTTVEEHAGTCRYAFSDIYRTMVQDTSTSTGC
jgi:hypothetical protein